MEREPTVVALEPKVESDPAHMSCERVQGVAPAIIAGGWASSLGTIALETVLRPSSNSPSANRSRRTRIRSKQAVAASRPHQGPSRRSSLETKCGGYVERSGGLLRSTCSPICWDHRSSSPVAPSSNDQGRPVRSFSVGDYRNGLDRGQLKPVSRQTSVTAGTIFDRKPCVGSRRRGRDRPKRSADK